MIHRNVTSCFSSTTFIFALAFPVVLFGQINQAEYYKISKVPTPEGIVLEVGDFEFMPDGRLAASSRRGDIYMFHNPLQADASKITSRLYMDGLHEVLGLAEDRRARGLLDRNAHLVGDRLEGAREDRKQDRIDVGFALAHDALASRIGLTSSSRPFW